MRAPRLGDPLHLRRERQRLQAVCAFDRTPDAEIPDGEHVDWVVRRATKVDHGSRCQARQGVQRHFCFAEPHGERQIDIENEIRGTLRSFGLKLAGRIAASTFEHRALKLLEDRPRLVAIVRPMLAARRALREQCAVLHKMLIDAVRADATCKRLMTVPGVGPLVAVSYLVTIDDPDRFHRSRDVGAHLGLTPTKYASGEVDKNGRISKCGDAMLRAALYQAALALLTRTSKWSALRAWGMAVAKRRGMKRAVVAVSRKLAVVLHRIWTDGTQFRWSREEAVA